VFKLKKKKIFPFRTCRPISIKLGTNHLWVKGIINCSYKGEIVTKIKQWGGVIKKIFFSRTTEPE
jgi:hypothetical protein